MAPFFALFALLFGVSCFGASVEEKPKPWYERYSLRGYAQLRYNRFGETNPSFLSDQGDKSIGDRNTLFFRRARLIFSGEAGDHVAFYIQPDFASSPATGILHFLQIRDFYADIFIDAAKEFRVRAGQSKVPFGFENMQSSQNRLELDRADAVNSAVKDERDLGLFFYWAPADIRKRFKALVDDGLKGSGDYGVFALGLYNGQTANRPETNSLFHYVARLTYPWEFAGQTIETSVQAYTGIFGVTRAAGIGGGENFLDQRVAVSLVLYPKPIGVTMEYVLGKGPELNGAQTAVQEGNLEGGYVLLNYKYDNLIPYVRGQYYLGGKKHETNSPRQKVYEAELGVEWQIFPQLELTVAYVVADRTSAKAPYVVESGRLARLQLQWNY